MEKRRRVGCVICFEEGWKRFQYILEWTTMRTLLIALMTVMTMDAAKQIEVHGHRGARTVLPENTLAGFEYAMKAGAEWIEIDLQATKDGVLVVSHDAAINTKICAGPGGETLIRKMTLDEVRAWDCGALKNADFPRQQAAPGQKIPTFAEILGLLKKGPVRINVEIKSNPKKPEDQPEPKPYAEMVAAEIRKHRAEKRVMIQSFDFRVLLAMKEVAPELLQSALFSVERKDLVEAAKAAGGTPMVSPNYNVVTREQVEKAHAAGLKVVAWTANTAEVWDKLVEAGVDGIITDDPAAVIAHLKGKGLR